MRPYFRSVKQDFDKEGDVFLDKIRETQKIEENILANPPKIELGQFALPVFQLAKEKKQNPAQFASELSKKLTQIKGNLWERVEATGPYLNFQLKLGKWNESVLKAGKVSTASTASTASKVRIASKVMVEYSQPNTHKEFHVGHLRNACLGSSLVNILRYQGNEVIAANYIGDAGVHVAKCLWFLQKKFPSGNYLVENKSKGEFLGQMYAEAVQKLEENPELSQEVSEIQRKLENQDSDMVKLWQQTKEWSMDGFQVVYDLLGVKFDQWFFESEEEIEGKKLINEIVKNKTIPEIKESEGAIIAELKKFGLDVLVLIKSDGNVLYGTKDLPLGKKKFDEFGIDKSIYLVDNRQSLYMKQIFKLLDLLGYEDKEKIHVAYDFVTLPDGAMASRKGNVITFMSLFGEMKKRLINETAQRHSDWSVKKIDSTAEKIALAALKFWMLKYENNTVIVFDMEKAMSIEVSTGPYLLYTVARINSILKKEKNKENIDFTVLKEVEEQSLIKHLSLFEESIVVSAEKYQGSYLCTYLIELAQKFNGFYHKHQVLKAENDVKQARLMLLKKVSQVLLKGLELLNIEAIK